MLLLSGYMSLVYDMRRALAEMIFIEYDKEAHKYDHFLNMYEIYVIT